MRGLRAAGVDSGDLRLCHDLHAERTDSRPSRVVARAVPGDRRMSAATAAGLGWVLVLVSALILGRVAGWWVCSWLDGRRSETPVPGHLD